MSKLMLVVMKWRTILKGLGITAVLVYIWNSFKCQAPTDWGAWLSDAIPMVLRLLGLGE